MVVTPRHEGLKALKRDQRNGCSPHSGAAAGAPYKADPAYGEGVAKGLGIHVEEPASAD